MRIASFCLIIAASLLGCPKRLPPVTLAAERFPEAAGGDAQVRVTLSAEPAAVVPGQTLQLRARFQVAPGWHIYAEDPGDSGLPTRVRVTAPPGLQVGATAYPPPQTFTSPGPVRSFGYAREVTLSTPLTVTAPPGGLAAAVTILARASWLACSDSCIPGSAALAVTLPPSRR